VKKSPAILVTLFVLLILGTGVGNTIAETKPNFKTSELDERLELIQVTDNIYAIVGPLGNRSPANLGNNATFGFVVTSEGILLIDPGGTYLGAKRIHDIIKSVSDKPVKFVINTGGQDHRWLGNDYFKKQGARIIASEAAVKDQKTRIKDIMFRLANTAGDAALNGTVDTYADITFDESYKFNLGDTEIEVHHHKGGAHSPGDSFVWLPQQSVIFSGDVVYLERLLSVMSFSSSKSWLSAFEALAAYNPKHIVPGHGKPATLAQAKRDTYGYLTMLRDKVYNFMDEGGAIEDVSKIDQSEFSYLENFDMLKGRNVQQVYQEMEWE
jgi:glyoxylase-like metal-dependent hydrolase (beta-lactamase superfamily II)